MASRHRSIDGAARQTANDQGPLKPSEVLDGAADLITPEGAWTQGAYARGSRNRPVKADAATAHCWCALGAIRKSMGGQSLKVVGYMHAVLGEVSILNFNDAPYRAQAEVIAALRKAAELARDAGQ